MMEFSSTLENQPIFRFLTFGVDAGLCFFLKLFLGSTVNYFPHPKLLPISTTFPPTCFKLDTNLGPITSWIIVNLNWKVRLWNRMANQVFVPPALVPLSRSQPSTQLVVKTIQSDEDVLRPNTLLASTGVNAGGTSWP